MDTVIFFSGLITMLVAVEIIRPIFQYNRWREREAYEEAERLHKMRVIKRYYPSLLGMTYEEIDRQYGVDSVYHTVGQLYLRSRGYEF